MGVNNQSILQRWLDGDRGSRINTTSSSSSTISISTPVTTTGSCLSLPQTLDSSTTSSVRSTPSSDGTPTVSDATRLESIQPRPNHTIDASMVTDRGPRRSNPATPHSDISQTDNGHMKRFRDETETTETSSEKSAKSTRVDTTTSLANIASLALQEAGCGPAHYILGLSAWLETVTEKEKASEVAITEALQRNKKQMATITSMRSEEVSLKAKAEKMEKERDTAQGAMQRMKTRLEAENGALMSDSIASKEQVRIQKLELEAAVERGKGYTKMEDERDAAQILVTELRLQLTEASNTKAQHEAAIKNADEARRQRNELQDTLAIAQADITRLVDENKTLLAEQEITAIELERYQTGFKKSQAVSAELNLVQTEITILRADNQRLVADNNRLSNEPENVAEVKEKSRINQRLADDRLQERQEMEAELRQAKAERKESEERAKKADGKAEEIKKNWHIAKNELLDVHRRNRKLKVELKKHANCPGGNIVKRE
jgi:hypothetical protein